VDWYLKVIKNYTGFTGRARRKEYWMYCLFYIIIGIAIGVVERVIGMDGVLSGLYSLALLLPSIAVSIRRMHDTGRSGFWILINFIPILGWLVFLFFAIQDSQSGDNEYGPNPKAA